LEYAAQSRDREPGLVIPHEPEDPSGIVPVSLANQAAAFDRMSFHLQGVGSNSLDNSSGVFPTRTSSTI
jgi:hypothetical protein